MPGETEGQILGGLLNAGGNIAGAFLSQESNSDADRITPSIDPRNNLTLAASNFDALNQLGFGNINNVPGPFAQIVDQINSLAITEKTKRRGLVALRQAFTGEKVTLPSYLKSVLTRVGLTEADLPDLIERDQAFKEQQNELSELGGINIDTIRNRALASQAASGLISDAARATQSGELSPFQSPVLDRINRSIDDSEAAALLRGQFGGFNPSAALEGIADLRADAELRAIEQSLLTAGGITQGLNGNLGINAAQNTIAANQGALGIAASQAQAANALRTGINARNAASLGNGIAGAFGSLGDAAIQAGASFNQDFQDFKSSIPAFGGGGGGGGGLGGLFGG